MNLKIQESTLKDLKNMDKAIAQKIALRLQKLQDYPDVANIKKLKNFYPPFRYRI